MRCREVQHKLDLFVTQELTYSECEKVQAHLESCAGCREALLRLRRLEDLLAASPAPPVPEGFANRVIAQVKAQQATAAARRAPRFPLARLAWKRICFSAATAAALAAGLMLGLFMGRDTWRSGAERSTGAASQPAHLLAASGFDDLVEPGGNSLAKAYLGLTTVNDR